MTRRSATTLGALLGILLLVLGASSALAQTALDVTLNQVQLEADGSTRLTVTVTGDAVGDDPLDGSAFAVTENGTAVDGVEVEPITDEADRPDVTMMLLFDISGSAAGEPLEAAKAAAIELTNEVVPAGVRVGLIYFGGEIGISLLPSDDATEVAAAIDELEAAGTTPLYDAIVLGADVLAGHDTERSLVLFTDGADTASEASIEDAIAAASVLDAPITNVALITPDQDPEVLDALAAGTDGSLLEVVELDELSDAFAQVAQSFTSQYVVTYVGEVLDDELNVAVTVAVDGEEASDGFLVLNSREEQQLLDTATAEPPPAALYDSGQLGTETALLAALGLAFAGLLVLLLVLLVPRGDRQASKTLRRGLAIAQRGGREARPSTGLSASAMGRRALDLVSAVPKPEGYEDRLQTDIDRAGWQLRAAEFLALRAAAAVLGALALGLLMTNVFAALGGLVAGAFLPALFLANARQRRQTKFMEQLPDTLQLLAGTLKAGYGTLQGIDTIVKEMDAPMSSEFQRVLTESRLGLPLEDSLEGMADRVDSEDFQWVVVAMNIQRQVGGNLAELLETVAETLRERQQVRRQIQVLAAEGKLSAVVLVALPFVLLGWMLITTPSFILPLVTTTIGQVMSAGAAVLMAAGILWMRKLIQIDV